MAYFETVTSQSILERDLKSEKTSGGLSGLVGPNDPVLTASKWEVEQLYACRVVCKRGNITLEDDSAVTVPHIELLIKAQETPSTLREKSSVELHQKYRYDEHVEIGAFWAAVAAVQPRRPVGYQGPTLRSASRIANSPIPPESSSSSSSSPTPSASSDQDYAATKENQDKYAVREEATVEVASIFIRQVLNNLPSQRFYIGPKLVEEKDMPSASVEYYSMQVRRTVKLSNGQEIGATGDGQLQVRRRIGSGYGNPEDPVVLLEAKRVQNVADDKASVGDSLLGQMTAEAITICDPLLGTRDPLPPVYIIYAVKATLRVFEFTIPADHLKAIKECDPSSKETIDVRATKQFNLENEKGRSLAVKAITKLAQMMVESGNHAST